MTMIDDARFVWRRWSTRIAAIQVGSILLWWAALPAEWKAAVPESWLKGAVVASGASFIIAQLIAQPKLQQRIQDTKGDQDAGPDKC